MITQIRLEAFKLTHRWRSYLGVIALAGLAGLMVLGVKLGGDQSFGATIPAELGAIGDFKNAGFVTWLLLNATIQFLLPLFACVVVGDMISGEASDGTLRALLSRPVSRWSVFAGKFVTSKLYVLALTLSVGIIGYIIGAIFLGHGAFVVFANNIADGQGQGVYVYTEYEGIVRLLAAYIYASAAVLAVASIAFFLSTLVSNSIGAIGGAMMTLVVFQIIRIIPYFEPIQPYLFTSHLETGSGLFMTPIPWAEIGKSLGVLIAYIMVFFFAGFGLFRRKDMLS